MTGRAKRADWFPLTLAVLKFSLALSVMAFISFQVAMGARTELTAEKDSAVSRVPLKKESIVLDAITDVENKQMERAMEKCLQIQEEDLPDEVKEYLWNSIQ